MANYALKIFGLFFLLCAECVAQDSFVWLEKPQEHNFNTNVNWATATEKSATGVMPNAPVPENPYFQYTFDLPADGRYILWGRTFDPAWSSPARMKIDNGEWTEFKPESRVDRQVFNKSFPLDWCKWTALDLKQGSHTLRMELTDKRKAGGYYYFVIDSLVLTTEPEYQPAGGETIGQQIAAAKDELSQILILMSDDAFREAMQKRIEQILAAGDNDYRKRENLKLMKKALENKIENGAKKKLSRLLHGVVNNLAITEKVSFDLSCNLETAGDLWVGIMQEDALYAATVIHTGNLKKSQRVEFDTPAGLPTGLLDVRCVVLNEPAAHVVNASTVYHPDSAQPVVKPSAWGVYRDGNRVMHPWHVNSANILMWEGKPYIPFGGMVNTRASWGTHIGKDEMDNPHIKQGMNILQAKLDLLKEYGIHDIYYNGFFLRSNPNCMREVVDMTEQSGMSYGLELSSVPSNYDKGFYYLEKYDFPIKAGETSITAKYDLDNPDNKKINRKRKIDNTQKFNPPYRCIWVLIDQAGQLQDHGVSTVSLDPDAEPGRRCVVLDAAFKQPATDGRLLCYAQMEIGASNPVGYLEHLQEYIDKVQDVYGTFDLGPNLRFFIDPLRNEMHADPLFTPSGEKFRAYYAAYLSKKYDSLSQLNAMWGATAKNLTGFHEAARLVPVLHTKSNTHWIDPETGALYEFSGGVSQPLRDLKEVKGEICRMVISTMSDTLKAIADVPVLIKHNLWFSDWFVNDRKSGGFDGIGMESYCYGDSLAYHNSLVAYGENLQSARNQWSVITETSAAAFEGQKDYCGYLDRMQMMDDLDQMMLYGAKGVYHFGFSFDPDGGTFFTTEITRDPRQLEWLATHGKIYSKAAARLATFVPQVYGWYPAYLRENNLTGGSPEDFSMDATYTGKSTQIRQAPDGNWIIPALNPYSKWKGLLVADDLLYPQQKKMLQTVVPSAAQYRLGQNQGYRLDNFTANGVGVISSDNKNVNRLEQFRNNVLGIHTFKTDTFNGMDIGNGEVMAWVCAEAEEGTLKLPEGVTVKDLEGNTIAVNSELKLKRDPHVQLTKDRPAAFPNGYYFDSHKQHDVVWIKGTDYQTLLALNQPELLRWLPQGIAPQQVKVWKEMEDFDSTTFLQPSVVGYSRYSGRAIGINTHFAPPAGNEFQSSYTVSLDADLSEPCVYIRKMITPAMDLAIVIDGEEVGVIKQDEVHTDALHLNPWNAGLSKNNIDVGWVRLDLDGLSKGSHHIRFIATGVSSGYEKDTTLMGGAAEADVGLGKEKSGMRALQLDCFMIVEK